MQTIWSVSFTILHHLQRNSEHCSGTSKRLDGRLTASRAEPNIIAEWGISSKAMPKGFHVHLPSFRCECP